MASQNKNLARYRRIVTKINKFETEMFELRDGDFAAKTALFKMRLQSGESLDSILPEAYALVREAAVRALDKRAFNVQLQGAIAVHEGKIVEMKTGEGKTLTIVFPAYLNSLSDESVHVVTANDYLAKRDAEWMNKVYALLGVSVGTITSQTEELERQLSYSADITYVSNTEVGFDFLKDNMLYHKRNKRQRSLHFAIIDEADSVLIDEAQTPLVISSSKTPEEKDKQRFAEFNEYVKKLRNGIDFRVNEKHHTVSLTIPGIKRLEKLLGVGNLYNSKIDYLYYIDRLLKAYVLFQKDRDYVIEKERVVIVDEFTGRVMPNHRFFQGIHQAIEAKEGLAVRDENKTLAQITFQHYFKKYRKIAGLTGTAESARKELRIIYKLDVVQIPTNKRVVRKDGRDRFFLDWEEKLEYLSDFVREHYSNQGAVLIGTRSIRKSQDVYGKLTSEDIPSVVLNAKHTAKEAEIIAQAGQPGVITVATNMAGRGTDIDLSESVREEMGLVVAGTERHNARRIDNQLIGRSGRQGDPGYTQFLISADDELIKSHFKKEYVKEIKKHKSRETGAQSPALRKIISKAQKRMEELFFDQRLLSYEFDRILEIQRSSFYRQRDRVLYDDDLKEETVDLLKRYAYRNVILPQQTRDQELSARQVSLVGKKLKRVVINNWFKFNLQHGGHSVAEVRDAVYESIENYYDDAEKYVSTEKMRKIEKTVTLKVLDLLWVEHLNHVHDLQQAALISSISKADFFEEYEIEMAKKYRAMLLLAPRVISQTLLRTMNTLLSSKMNLHKKSLAGAQL